MRPSLLIIPANETPGVLMPQIPFNGTADFTVSRTTTPANNSTRVNSSGLIEIVNNNVPRIDYLNQSCPALLVEPAATNQIRNNSMVGAVAGTSGSLPTNWSNQLGGGITQTVVGIGTENGVSYIDIRISGTQNDTTPTDIRFESTTQIVASNGQTWSESVWLKIVEAPNPPINYRLYMFERDSGGVFIKSATQVASLTTTLTRYSFTRALDGGATVARVQPALTFTTANGSTYDFTIRIGYPQMEQSSFATSVIPTTTGIGSRDADVISASNISGLIGQTEGTIYAEVDLRTLPSVGIILSINTGNAVDRIEIYITSNGKVNFDRLATTQSATTSLASFSTYSVNSILKIAIGYKSGDTIMYINGIAETSQQTATFTFATIFRVNIGSGRLSTSSFNNRIRTAALYTTRLSNDDLIRLTLPSTYVTYNDMALGLAYTIK